MSELKIRIRGEEAEAFANMLKELSEISPLTDDINKGSGNGKIIVLLLTVGFVADTITISQGLANLKQQYDKWHSQGKVEARIEYPDEDKMPCEFSEFLASHSRDPLETFNEDIPSLELPSLQELAKLPVSERHKILAPYMKEMAEIFNNDPELNYCQF